MQDHSGALLGVCLTHRTAGLCCTELAYSCTDGEVCQKDKFQSGKSAKTLTPSNYLRLLMSNTHKTHKLSHHKLRNIPCLKGMVVLNTNWHTATSPTMQLQLQMLNIHLGA